jgi:formiminotetrahydrofolate cyclodeaminase
MSQTQGTWTISGLSEQVATPDQFAGGGAVAAMSLAGAAATAELVFQLSSSRKKLEEADRQRLSDAVTLCQRLRTMFQLAIDEDIAALTELMDAQSALRSARRYGEDIPPHIRKRADDAVEAATETPLRLARDGKRLLRTIEELQSFSRTFTRSDLGAAAATCAGAITSLLLMAEVNLSLVSDESTAQRIAQEIEDLYSQSQEQANRVVASTRSVIR